MKFILPILKALYRHKWLILIGTILVTAFVYYYTRHMRGDYDVKATLYTGVASGYNLESDQRTDWALVQNTMDNLISIIQAESTLKKVSLHLLARVLILGSPDKDQNGITAASYQYTYNHIANSPVGKELLALIDKNSEEKTTANLESYMKPVKENYLYGLLYYNHPYYSLNALKRIQVQRRLSSDLMDVSYSSGDPGIAFNTVSILMEEFVDEYRRIRYGETDKVIEYFRTELGRVGKLLRHQEDSLTSYNVNKRVINYLDETKEIAAINKEYELREQDVLFAYNSAKAMLQELEKHMDSNVKQIVNNLQFIDKLKEASAIAGRISEKESVDQNNTNLDAEKQKLSEVRGELNELTDKYIEHKYTKEGVARTNIINQWLDQTLLFEKAKSDLQIIQQARQELNDKYVFFAPVGTTIRRQERAINFTERSYLTILQSYNEALMRKKNLEMTSATLKVLNDPMYPISSNPTNRKMIVMAACAVTFLLLCAIIILIEILDRTLRDALRAQRIVKIPVAGVLPGYLSKYQKYYPEYMQFAMVKLSNVILRFLTERKSLDLYIVNLVSTTHGQGTEEVAGQLKNFWTEKGLRVNSISWQKDYEANSSAYKLAASLKDFYTPGDEDVLIVEYPPLEDNNLPEPLLRDANFTLLVASAKYGWKQTDNIANKILQSEIGTTPLYLCLTDASREAVESFTGLLPPYTLIRRLQYRFSQLSLSETMRQPLEWYKSKEGQNVDEEEDDE